MADEKHVHDVAQGSFEPRMDGSLVQRLLWRIEALREGLSDVVSMGTGVATQVARSALLVDDGNAELCAAAVPQSVLSSQNVGQDVSEKGQLFSKNHEQSETKPPAAPVGTESRLEAGCSWCGSDKPCGASECGYHRQARGPVQRSSADTVAPPSDLAARIELYLDDMPSDGAHSDAAGGDCWDLLREARDELRAVPQTSPVIPADQDAMELAYGLLWTVGCDRSTPNGQCLYLARKALYERMTKEGQARGITAAREAIAANPPLSQGAG